MARAWSELQVAFFEAVKNTTRNLVLLARAGSGKTTTIIEACSLVPGRAVFLAFNKEIQIELDARVPKNTEALTSHSFGFRAVRKVFGNLKVNRDRDRDIVLQVLPRSASRGDVGQMMKLVSMSKAWLASDVIDVINLANGYGCVPEDDTTSLETWASYALRALELAKKVTREISFDDMVWLPIALNLPVEKADVAFIDETQDWNRCQLELALRAAKRIIAVGDDRQAIYAFRGADALAMQRITERLDALVLPLNVTYRCAVNIVTLAQQFVPDLQAAPNAIDGTVASMTEKALMKDVAPGDAILSRTNAPLMRICLSLLRNGRRAAIRGKEVGDGLVSLVKKSKTYSIQDLSDWLRAYTIRETDRLARANKEEQIAELEDRIDTLHVLAEGCITTADLIARIESLFDDNKQNDNRILLSSTHKAKGLEWDRVWMLADTYRPGRSQEEDNLCYVAITRAKRELIQVSG